MEQTGSVQASLTPGAATEDLDGNSRAANVARIFAEIFELDSVPVDADFFELGGDSLIAAVLTSEIERRFGVGLSISVLFESPSPLALADAILAASRKQQERILIPVKPNGSGPAIFCVHGTDGESLFPYRLMRALRQDRPIYGLRAFGLEAGECPLASIEAMADLYMTAVAAEQPRGRYILLGHCGGTMAAWEMAQRMIARGREVAGLILVDPEAHLTCAPYLHRSGLALGMFQAGASKRANEIATNFETDPPEDAEARRLLVRDAFNFALGCYTPKPLACPTLLMCSEERRPMLLNSERGYQQLLSNFRCIEFSGSHMAIFDSHLDRIAGEIRNFLDLIAPPPSRSAVAAA